MSCGLKSEVRGLLLRQFQLHMLSVAQNDGRHGLSWKVMQQELADEGAFGNSLFHVTHLNEDVAGLEACLLCGGMGSEFTHVLDVQAHGVLGQSGCDTCCVIQVFHIHAAKGHRPHGPGPHSPGDIRLQTPSRWQFEVHGGFFAFVS